jgi:Leucine-rich repeat (LRR) protein
MRTLMRYDVRNMICKNHRKSYIIYLISYIFLILPFKGFSQDLLDSLSLDTLTACTSIQDGMADTANVLKLDLSKQKLKEFPNEIRKFVNLQYLDLSKNKITEVPAWIGELKNLQVLILSKNKIENLPDEFGQLSHLKDFIMNRSSLHGLPRSIGNLKELRTLNLWQDDLSYFPPELKDISGNLKTLDLRDVLVPDATQAHLRAILPNTAIYFSPICACER